MIFDDLLNTLVARLNNDAFFSDPAKGLQVIAANRMDLLTEVDIALNKLGIVAVLEVTRVVPDQIGAYHGSVVVTLTLQVHEIPLLNRAESGSQKTAQQCLVKSRSLWDRPWTPDRDVWSPLQLQSFQMTSVDEATAMVVWSMEYTTMTMLETVVEVLATESGVPLVTQSQENLFVSPTAP